MILTALVIFLGGSIWTIVHSFTKSKLLPKLKFVGFDQYERLWGTSRWLTSIENLLVFGVCSLIFSLIIGFLLAALLDQKIRFEDTFRTIFLYPFALSFIVTGLVWQWILNPTFGVQSIVRSLGFDNFVFDPLYNSDIVIYGVLIAALWQGTGLVMCLMLAGMRGNDKGKRKWVEKNSAKRIFESNFLIEHCSQQKTDDQRENKRAHTKHQQVFY